MITRQLLIITWLQDTDNIVHVYHDKKDIPDEEAGSSGGATGSWKRRVLELGILIDAGRDSLPRLDVTMQLPLLFVDERLNVNARDLAAVFLQLYFDVRSLRRHGQGQVLQP